MMGKRDPMPPVREKFATRVNREILQEVRALAAREGRQMQALVDEALGDLIEKRKNARFCRRLRISGR